MYNMKNVYVLLTIQGWVAGKLYCTKVELRMTREAQEVKRVNYYRVKESVHNV